MAGPKREDLHVAPVITWWNKQNLWSSKKAPADPLVRFDGNRYYHLLGGEDEREGGALLYFQLKKPLAIANAIASGRATTPTITPAVRSAVNCDRLYDFSVVIDFGTSKTVGPLERAVRPGTPGRLLT